MRQIFTLISCLSLFLISSAQTSKRNGDMSKGIYHKGIQNCWDMNVVNNTGFADKLPPLASNSTIASHSFMATQTPNVAGSTIILLRCGSTIDIYPLLVLDGEIREWIEVKNIDPNSIKEIMILRGPEAAAIFGSRGVNGVVVIKTKFVNQRVILVKDSRTGEVLSNANVQLSYKEAQEKLTINLSTDSVGQFVTDKIIPGKDYELKVSSSDYTSFKSVVNSKNVGKNYTVLLEKKYKEFKELNFKIYPNPVMWTQKINIEFKSENEKKLTLRLFELGGKLINSKDYSLIQGLNRFNYTFDSKIASGLYIVQICDTNNKVIKSEKLVIQ